MPNEPEDPCELAARAVSKARAERVAASAACTGADFHTRFSDGGNRVMLGAPLLVRIAGSCESPASRQDPAPDIVMMSSGGADPVRAAAVHSSADKPIARRIKRRTSPF